MNDLINIEPTIVNYTVIVDTISDMSGFTVEIVDKYNLKNYTLSKIYPNKEKAIQEADAFVNNLFEVETSMNIN